MNKRYIIGTDIGLSPITLGTMRFADKSLSQKDVITLMQYALDYGINTHHISSEYSSFDIVSNAYKAIPVNVKQNIQVITKLAAPHFDESRFSTNALVKRVDDYLGTTGLSKISLVQWMWRMNPSCEQQKKKMFLEDAAEFELAIQQLKQAGKVDAFCCFPYSKNFMHVVNKNSSIHGQADYLNFYENAFIDFDELDFAVVLRPFFAGKCFEDTQENRLLNKNLNKLSNRELSLAQYSLIYPLLHPKVSTSIVSLHNSEQIDFAVDTLSKYLTINAPLFHRFKECQTQI